MPYSIIQLESDFDLIPLAQKLTNKSLSKMGQAEDKGTATSGDYSSPYEHTPPAQAGGEI